MAPSFSDLVVALLLLAPLYFDLFLQAGDFLRPPEFVDPCHDVGVIREFGRKLVALEFAVEAVLAEGLVHLRVVASPRSGDGMLDIETRGIAHEVGQADLVCPCRGKCGSAPSTDGTSGCRRRWVRSPGPIPRRIAGGFRRRTLCARPRGRAGTAR